MRHATALLLVLISGAPLMIAACGGGMAVSRTIDDATVTTRVKTALLNDTAIDPTKIDVDTAGGVVTLTGVVKSKDEEMKAVDLARRVTGVRDVKSLLKIDIGKLPARS